MDVHRTNKLFNVRLAWSLAADFHLNINAAFLLATYYFICMGSIYIHLRWRNRRQLKAEPMLRVSRALCYSEI